MKTRPTLFAGFRWRWFMAAAALAITIISELRAVDLSGTYENFGSMINPEKEADVGTISLQGLLNQEFDYKLTRIQHSHIDGVVIEQTSDRLSIDCLDTEGKLTWGGHWKHGAGYSAKDGQVDLIVRSKRNKDDAYLFSISSVSDQQLLLVAVNHIQATAFGPVSKPLGTFLFSPKPASPTEDSKSTPANGRNRTLPSPPRHSRSNLQRNKPCASPGNSARHEPFSPPNHLSLIT